MELLRKVVTKALSGLVVHKYRLFRTIIRHLWALFTKNCGRADTFRARSSLSPLGVFEFHRRASSTTLLLFPLSSLWPSFLSKYWAASNLSDQMLNAERSHKCSERFCFLKRSTHGPARKKTGRAAGREADPADPSQQEKKNS